MHDDTDRDIIGLLRADARRTDGEIADTLGVDKDEVGRRISDMVRDGRISGFTMEEEDTRTRAIVLVSVESSTESSQVSEALAGLDGVDTVYEITGRHDIATIISNDNIAAINTTIDALRKIRGVTDTNTMIILRRVRPDDPGMRG